jgi:hypothetical protein
MEHARQQMEEVDGRKLQGAASGARRIRPMAAEAPSAKPAYSFWLVAIGIASVSVIFLMTVGVFRDEFSEATEVLSALASVFAMIGTLTGAYFGVKASSDARQTAEDARQQSVAVSHAVLARSEPHAGEEALRYVVGDHKR